MLCLFMWDVFSRIVQAPLSLNKLKVSYEMTCMRSPVGALETKMGDSRLSLAAECGYKALYLRSIPKTWKLLEGILTRLN